MNDLVARKSISTKKLALNGIMIALVFLATFFTKIPIPATQGYFNIGDTVIIIAAILIGRNSGFIAGAFGSALADLATGYLLYAPFTFVIKGIEGYVIGLIASKKNRNLLQEPSTFNFASEIRRIIAMIVGVLIMVAGYFFSEAYLLGLFDKTFSLVVAVNDLLMNLLQGGISVVVGYILVTVFDRLGIKKILN
jgi:uncharacterized membrane protein